MKSHTLCLDQLVIGREQAPLTAPISLAVHSGEMLLVQGSNGSGKSTLLKMIAGLLPPVTSAHAASGHLDDAGAPLPTGEGASKLAPANPHPIRFDDSWPITPPPLYLGHKRGLVTELTVLDNVAFWAKLSRCEELIEAALHYFDLEDIVGVTLERLSAGWQQRVALTRLITHPSPLWLLDEPTSNLDQEGTALLQSLIQTRLEQHGIVVIASHIGMEGERVRTLSLNAHKRTISSIT